MKRMRILCLHGYHGSAQVLQRQMASLTRGLDSLAEFVSVDAPALAQGDFGWWHAVEGENGSDREDPGVDLPARHYRGWARTREGILNVFEHQGPFDGIFGFSQGAALAALLVGLRAGDGKAIQSFPLNFGFAVLVSGFVCTDVNLAKLYDSKLSYNLPSAHIIGRSDYVVPRENSRRLAANFSDALIIEHAGGHVVADTPDVRSQFKDFLERMVDGRKDQD
jgi:pimeloyl-ACP methyl ester carboxylesterase